MLLFYLVFLPTTQPLSGGRHAKYTRAELRLFDFLCLLVAGRLHILGFSL